MTYYNKTEDKLKNILSYNTSIKKIQLLENNIHIPNKVNLNFDNLFNDIKVSLNNHLQELGKQYKKILNHYTNKFKSIQTKIQKFEQNTINKYINAFLITPFWWSPEQAEELFQYIAYNTSETINENIDEIILNSIDDEGIMKFWQNTYDMFSENEKPYFKETEVLLKNGSYTAFVIMILPLIDNKICTIFNKDEVVNICKKIRSIITSDMFSSSGDNFLSSMFQFKLLINIIEEMFKDKNKRGKIVYRNGKIVYRNSTLHGSTLFIFNKYQALSILNILHGLYIYDDTFKKLLCKW